MDCVCIYFQDSQGGQNQWWLDQACSVLGEQLEILQILFTFHIAEVFNFKEKLSKLCL